MTPRRSKIPRSPTIVTTRRSPRHAAERSRVPRLSPEDLDDASKLGALTDAVVGLDDNYSKLTAKILRAQDRLQSLSDSDAWIAFLEVEQLVNARVNASLTTVARWAFNEGRRQRRRRRG